MYSRFKIHELQAAFFHSLDYGVLRHFTPFVCPVKLDRKLFNLCSSEKISELNTVILPLIERDLLIHELQTALILSSCGRKFHSQCSCVDLEGENQMPKILTLFANWILSGPASTFSSLGRSPRGRIADFSLFILRPEKRPNRSRDSATALRDVIEDTKHVVSSVNWVILHSSSRMMTPCIALFFLIMMASSSTAIKSKGEMQQP